MTTAITKSGCALVSSLYSAYLDKFRLQDQNLLDPSMFLGSFSSLDSNLVRLLDISVDGNICRVDVHRTHLNGDFTPVECEPYQGLECTSIPSKQTYTGYKCSYISSYFKTAQLGKTLSGCDFECKLRSFTDVENLMYQSVPELLFKALSYAEKMYFAGLYAKRFMCYEGQSGDFDFYNLNPAIGNIYALSSGQLLTSPKGLMMRINGANKNLYGSTNFYNNILYVDNEFFTKYIEGIDEKINSCCQLLTGIFDTSSMSPFYIDRISQITIVAVPSRYLAYDTVSHRYIYPLVNPSLYKVVGLPKAIAGEDAMRRFYREIGGNTITQIANKYLPISVRIAGSSAHEKLGAYMSYFIKCGSLMFSNHAVNYILADKEADNTKFENSASYPVTLPNDVKVITF